MKLAKYKNGFIRVGEYNSKLHFGNIFCPDCGKAKLKLIRKANEQSFFGFVKGEDEHDELCPRVSRPIMDGKIKDLISSESKKDLSKLNFLVNKNLERCINLLTKLDNKGELNDDNTLNLMPRKKQQLLDNRTREYSRQDIYTINALELSDIDIESLNGSYAVLYGVAGITSSDINDSKKLLFKIDQQSRFSIFIAPAQVKYLDFDVGKRAKFAVFGKLKKVGKFINIEIRSTRDLVVKG